MKLKLILCLATLIPLHAAYGDWKEADGAAANLDSLRKEGYKVSTITPVFSQLISIPYPDGFEVAYENTSGPNYIQESVLHGETVEKWTQMLTLTGAKGLASNPNATPQAVLSVVAQGFMRACPSSYSGSGLGELKFAEFDAFAAVVSCGTLPSTGQSYSESTLILTIKGKSDYYTVQWALRGAPSTIPISINDAEWNERLKKITPIKLCSVLPGEKAPYPSCVEKNKM